MPHCPSSLLVAHNRRLGASLLFLDLEKCSSLTTDCIASLLTSDPPLAVRHDKPDLI